MISASSHLTGACLLPPLRLRWALLTLCALLAFQASALAEELASEHWYSVHVDGRKIGHLHASRSVDEGVVTSARHLQLSIDRNGETLVVRSSERSIESVDGHPHGFASDIDLAGTRSQNEARIEDGMVRATSTTPGESETQSNFPWPAGAMLAEGQRLAMLRHALAPGVQFDVFAFDPTSQRVQQLRWLVLGPQVIEIHGTSESLIALRQTIDAEETAVIAEVWINPQDRSIRRMQIPALSLKLDLLACDRTCALAPDQPSDVLAATLITAPRPLSRAERSQPLQYRLGIDADHIGVEQAQAMHELPGQQVDADADGYVSVTVDPAGGTHLPPTALDLQATRWVQSDANEIQALARRAIGRQRDPRVQMQRLEQGVRRHIVTKSLRIGYASALETYRLREGDCTEHALLLAALARASGIPARVATGIVYASMFGGQPDMFVPHAWVFAWIDGRWQGFDAAQPGHGSGHIAFSADHGDPFRFYRGIELLGRLQITRIDGLAENIVKEAH